MPFLPFTLTLSPKGRGEITFDKTSANIGRLGDGKQVVFSPPGEGARV
jgi:hypothetical protein